MKFKCDCSGHELIAEYDNELQCLTLIIRDKHLKKQRFKVKGYEGDVVLMDREKLKPLSDFSKFIAQITKQRGVA